MRIGVIGRKGQLAQSIDFINNQELEIDFFGKETLDISETSIPTLKECLKDLDVLINCAAFTAVDLAERQSFEADKLNNQAIFSLAKVCKELGVFFIHISTDYVFDGQSSQPYREEDQTNPKTIYGKSKLKGEEHILNSKIPSIVIRTSWLFSPFGNNFYNTIKEKMSANQKLSVVTDQSGTPTSALDLARVILELAKNHQGILQPEIFHVANSGVASWYELALTIRDNIYPNYPISSIKSNQLNQPAVRPRFSALSSEKLKKSFNISMRSWEQALEEVIYISQRQTKNSP